MVCVSGGNILPRLTAVKVANNDVDGCFPVPPGDDLHRIGFPQWTFEFFLCCTSDTCVLFCSHMRVTFLIHVCCTIPYARCTACPWVCPRPILTLMLFSLCILNHVWIFSVVLVTLVDSWIFFVELLIHSCLHF